IPAALERSAGVQNQMRFYPQAASSAFAVCGFFTVNTLPDFTLTYFIVAINKSLRTFQSEEK
ncbi:hypothetical protein, partial [uncultured Ruminococcus sp.]|uniref:hypothetical protein n=1 Tax=uncultured Ruminococcus sp. TaxID=165186 RepID=UPI0025DB211D